MAILFWYTFLIHFMKAYIVRILMNKTYFTGNTISTRAIFRAPSYTLVSLDSSILFIHSILYIHFLNLDLSITYIDWYGECELVSFCEWELGLWTYPLIYVYDIYLIFMYIFFWMTLSYLFSCVVWIHIIYSF